MTIILQDTDLADPSCMITAIAAVKNFMLAYAHGKTLSPPRHHVAFSNYGDLVFTIGGNMDDKPLAGFRVYDTFAGSGQTQLVAVWAVDSGQLKGLVLGTQLGALRTGAIGGVAIRYLSDPNAQSIGIIGSGLQART